MSLETSLNVSGLTCPRGCNGSRTARFFRKHAQGPKVRCRIIIGSGRPELARPMSHLGRQEPLAQVGTDGRHGWLADLPPRYADRQDCAHGGRSKPPRRHSSADIRQLSARVSPPVRPGVCDSTSMRSMSPWNVICQRRPKRRTKAK